MYSIKSLRLIINNDVQFFPKELDHIWYLWFDGRISDMLYEGKYANNRRLVEAGNCFKSFEDAEYANKRLSELFVHIHREILSGGNKPNEFLKLINGNESFQGDTQHGQSDNQFTVFTR